MSNTNYAYILKAAGYDIECQRQWLYFWEKRYITRLKHSNGGWYVNVVTFTADEQPITESYKIACQSLGLIKE